MALGIGVSGLSRGSVDVGVGFIGFGEGSRVSRLHVLICSWGQKRACD